MPTGQSDTDQSECVPCPLVTPLDHVLHSQFTPHVHFLREEAQHLLQRPHSAAHPAYITYQGWFSARQKGISALPRAERYFCQAETVSARQKRKQQKVHLADSKI